MLMASLEWKTPHEVLFGGPPSYDKLRVMGYLCYIAKHPCPEDKFDSRGIQFVFLSYAHGQKAYRVFDLSHKMNHYFLFLLSTWRSLLQLHVNLVNS